MIYIKLLFTFFKIGLFSFGGGYAMIPLVQKDIEANGWLSASEFVDIIAIAEMTPGPIAVNLATFVGYKAGGIPGGIIATAGVALPSLILILIISRFFFKYQNHPVNIMIFYGIRPVVMALIITAGIFVAQTALFNAGHEAFSIVKLYENPLEVINIKGVIIMVLALAVLIRFKLHPILLIAASGAAGILLFHIL
jgi:chromate transporter